MKSLAITSYLIMGTLLFIIGILGVLLNRHRLLILLLCLEIMFLGVCLNFLSFGYFHHDTKGTIIPLFILGISTARLIIGLALVTSFYRSKNTLSLNDLKDLKG